MPVYLLTKEIIFPSPFLAEKDGLLAIGGDLSPDRLINAYYNGIFPWYSEGSPILWWSPDPRFVIFIDKFHIPKRLKRLYKQKKFRTTVDENFEEVIKNCAMVHKTKNGGTWITEDMISAYIELHKKGFAHSVETWHEDKLVGGLYGVTIGSVFSGESMFSIEDNASKIALIALYEHLKSKNFKMIDCQTISKHLKQFGALPISRTEFIKLLRKLSRDNTKF